MSRKDSCTVWVGGKGGDNLKTLPIHILIEFYRLSMAEVLT